MKVESSMVTKFLTAQNGIRVLLYMKLSGSNDILYRVYRLKSFSTDLKCSHLSRENWSLFRNFYVLTIE